MPYTPAIGHRIIVRRTPGKHTRTSSVTGLVLNIVTISKTTADPASTSPPTSRWPRTA